MEIRRIEKLRTNTSLLGFGCMRFPMTSEGSIDEIRAEKMIDMAYEAGVNYFDTAYTYHEKSSEPFVGKVLDKYDRKSYYLATKLPVWMIETKEDVRKIFEEQLERLHKDYVDFYLLHALDKERWEKTKTLKIIETCEELLKEGKIKHLGFSFHDDYEVFEEILTSRNWDFCQIQYNYMDTKEQAGDKGYALAEKLGVPFIIMEPVRGGSLAGFSKDIEEQFHKLDKNASMASYALRWVASHSNVKVVLSGMSTEEQVVDNLKTFVGFRPLNLQEQDTIEQTVTTLKARVQNGCTGCAYCMPCPEGVNIPKSFHLWNQYHIYQKYQTIKNGWENMEEKERPFNCIQCGKCETVCPQHISIREDLQKVQKELTEIQN
ncbi:MAG: aldo/keto reductase [Lachnospiraceae bacterium]